MKRILVLLIGVFVLNSLQAQDVKKIKWEKDIKTLQKQLPEKHKYLFYVRTRAEFNKDIESVLGIYKNLSNLGVALKMQQVIAEMGDSHTGIGWRQFVDISKTLPLVFYWFNDGIYVLQTVKDYEPMLGKKVLRINQTPVSVVVDSLSTLITQDNLANVKKQVPGLISSVQLLEHFNFVTEGKVVVETEDLFGKIQNFEVQPSMLNRQNRIMCKTDSFAYYLQNENLFFTEKYFESDDIYYIQYNMCYSREYPPYNFKGDVNSLPSFVEFENRVVETIRNKPVKKLIVDLRLNGGGSSVQGTEFIKKLSEIEKVNQNGVLYVIIGRRTYSSAIINAMDFKNYTKATLVGEETSGKPNHFGEVRSFELPNSGLKVYYSTRFFRRAEKDVSTINPDFKVEESFNDFQSGVDPVYEWIKNR